MAQQGGRIDFQVGFKTDKSGIQELKKSLQDIQKIKPANFDGTKEDLRDIRSTAAEVETALSKAFNPNINSINLKTFDNELKTSHKSIEDIYASFSKAGAQGEVAFSQMARAVLTTNQQLKQTHSIINQMGTTMVNTVKWGIASSIMNGFISSVQGAFTYVENLEKSLTNIRIVTGDSQQKMEQFADSANRAAQELGRSTMDYSKAALTFYQQGLSDQDVQARTEAVLKAQNITGAGSQMADYLTAVWNGYKVANEQAQVYVDKLAAVADSSASDMSQLAVAMSKVASTANNLGVDADQLNAQLATVVATTRQAPQAVGTAFKTIYTRINDIKAGSDEAEISLGNYSGKMAELGFNVLDATGHLRDTGQVMQEIGNRWGDLTKEQQIYLATTMGGQRQVNQLIALFDNWTTYSELLNVSLESEGTLVEKNGRYMESLGAKMEQLGAAGERVKASLIDSESFGAVIELLTAGTNLLGTFIEGIGGGGTALLGLGGIATQVFSGVISKEINNAIVNYQNMKSNIEQVQIEIQKTQEFAQSQGFSNGAIQQMISEKQKIQQLYAVMSEQEKQSYNSVVNSIGATKEQVILLQERVNKGREFNDILKQTSIGENSTFKEQQKAVVDSLNDIIESMEEYHAVAASGDEKDTFTEGLIDQFQILEYMIGTKIPASFKPYFDKINELIAKRTELKTKISEQLNKDVVDTNALDKLKNDLTNINKEVREAVENALPEVSQTVKFSVDFETNTQQLEQARQKLVELQNETARLQQQMSQALTVRGIVEGVGQLGRATSAVMALTNGVKGLFDNSVPPMERFGKLLMSMGYSIPTLLSSYSRLATLTQSLSAATVNATTVAQAKKAVDQAQVILDRKKTSVNLLLQAQQKGLTVNEGLLTAAKQGERVATEQLEGAQIKLNAAMTANPIGLVVTAIAVLVGAVAGAISIYDAFTMSNKQADEALQNFNNKITETNSKIKDYSSNIGNLSSAEEEWDSLSKKAGDYNSTINNLTEDEKQRYYELSDLIAQYNPLAVAGYDEQGKAIIRNNDALKETIQLLKKKRQEELNSTYSGEDFDKAEQARQTKAKNANKKRPEGEDLSNSLEKTTIDISRYLTSYGDNLDGELKKTNDRIREIIAGGRENILKNKEELVSIFSELSTKKEDLPDIGVFLYDGYIDGLEQSVKDFNDKQKEVDDQLKGIISDHEKAVLGVLQTDLDGRSYYNEAEEAGMFAINNFALNYLHGMEKFNADGSLKKSQQLAQQLEDDIIQPLYQLFTETDDNGNVTRNLYQEFIDSLLDDEKLQNSDFKNLTQKNDYIAKLVEDYIQNNLEEIKALEPSARAALEGTFNEIFGVDNIKINFDTGKVEKQASEAVQRLTNRIVKNGKASANETSFISDMLRPDLTVEEIDYITEHLEEAIKKYGDWQTAINALQNQASASVNLDTNLGTMGLLDKQARGENLGKEEQEALITGLQTLKDSYPGLIEQVEILQTEWMQGTSAYEDALRKVKLALIDTLGDSLNQSIAGLKENTNQYKQALEDYNQKLLNLVQTTEDYQTISNLENASLQTKQNSLIKLATAYENAKGELQEYYRVMNQENSTPEEEQTARMGLERATRAGEIGQKEDIDPERIQALADRYAELASQGQQAYEGLDQNAELAVDAATRYIKLNDAIADLQQNYDKMTQVLNDLQSIGLEEVLANEDLSKAFQQLKEDVADIVDTSEDLLGDDWIADNADKIQAAIEGDEEAVNALRESAQQEILANVGIDFEGFDEQKGEFLARLNELEDGADIMATMDLDDVAFLQNLVSAMQQAGMAQNDIENALSGLGIDVDLAPYEEGLNSAIDEAKDAGLLSSDAFASNAGVNVNTVSSTDTQQDTVEAPGYEVSTSPVPFSVSLPTVAPATFPGLGISIPYFTGRSVQKGSYPEIAVAPRTEPVDSTKETTGTSLQVIGARKSSGGKVSHKNRSGGNHSGGGGKNKGKGRSRKPKKSSKSSSSPKTETPKQPKVQKAVKDTQDRYHDVNLKLKDVDTQLTKVQQKQQKLTGPSLLKNLEKQQKLLDKQVATYKEKLQIEKQEADEVRNRLIKDGVLFNADGSIANYSTALSKALADYNKVIKEYNSMSAEDQQKNKDMLDSAKQKYENFKNDISRYDKITSEEIPNLQKSIRADLDKKTELQIQQFKLKVELELDSTQAEKDFKEFRNKVVKQLRDDDVLGQAKALKNNYGTYYKNGYDVIQSLTDQVRKTQRQIAIIDERGSSAVYGNDRAAALKDLKEYTDQLMKSLEDVEDIVNDIKETIFDAIDKAQDAFDEQRKQYEQIGDLIEHHQKMVQLLYGDDAYYALNNYYKMQQDNNKKQLDFLSKQKDLWYARMQVQQKALNSLPKGSNEWKEANERFEQYKKHWMDSLNDLNDLIEDSLDVVIDRYLNKIDLYFNQLENKLTKNKGFQHLGEEWELINKQADMYLDQVNSMYETDKLENAYKDAIKNNEGNVKAQKSLTNMMNQQLKYLKDKDKLTQYDVDRANALLQIEIKRLALETQRQNKTKLRLRRDSQGNYTYQYTADEQAKEQAQQELADAENSLYNMTKQAYKNNLNSYYDTVTEWQDKVKDVYKDTTLTVDEQQKKVALLNEYYGDIINGLTQNNEDLKKFMMQDTFDEMSKMYNTNVENYHAMTQKQKDIIMSEMVPYWKSGIQEMANSVTNSSTGFLPLTTGAFNKIADATKKYGEELQTVKKYNDETFKDTKDNIDINITRTQDLLEKNDNLINSYKDELRSVQQVINQVQKLTQAYKKAKDEAIEATTAAYNFQQKDAKKVTEPPKTKEQIQKEQIQREYNSTISDIGSYLRAGQDPLQIFTQKMSSLGATSASNRQNIDQKRTVLQQEIDKYINQYLSEQERESYLKNRKNISSYATGGYTGDWGEDGKLAVLHQKELILNEQDTKHMLSAVSIVRTLDNILEGFKFNTADVGSSNIISSLVSNAGGASASQQYITINADFPAVKDRLQIEAAFDNLVNRASQFAFSNRK